MRQADRAEIIEVGITEPRGFGIGARYCVLRIDTGRSKLRFAFFGLLRNQRKHAREWQRAIEQWKN